MSSESWDEFFIGLAKYVERKSKDRTTKVGCVIVGPDNEVRSIGYNGFPRGVNDDITGRHERPAKYLWTEHSERNALYNCARVGIPTKGCKIYQGFIPCADCARGIIQSGINEVIVDGDDWDSKVESWKQRWKEHTDCSIEMLGEAGVKVRVFRPNGSDDDLVLAPHTSDENGR